MIQALYDIRCPAAEGTATTAHRVGSGDTGAAEVGAAAAVREDKCHVRKETCEITDAVFYSLTFVKFKFVLALRV